MGSHFVIDAICFVAGSLAGGLAVGVWFGKEYQKKIRNLQEEVAYLRDRNHAEKNEELKKREEKAAKEEVELELHSVINTLGYSSEASEEKEEVVVEEKPETKVDTRSKEQRKEDIYMIDAEEARDDMPYVETETLTYYQEDHILADAINDKIENGGALLGDDCMEKLASTDEEYIYVRDDSEEKIWEIIVDHEQSFYRDVQGVM